MRRINNCFILSLCLFSQLTAIRPVLANELGEDSLGEKVLIVPKVISGSVLGVTIGVPIAISKDVVHYSTDMRTRLEDDFGMEGNGDIAIRLLASSIALPYGIISGIIHGSIKGFEKGIEYGLRKPFSKESFSLKEPD